MISATETIALQWKKEAGNEEVKSLRPLKQFGKEVSNEEGIGKDQCPRSHSFEADFNPPYPFLFANTKNLISAHFFFPPGFCKDMFKFVLCLTGLRSVFESLFYNFKDDKTSKNNQPDKE